MLNLYINSSFFSVIDIIGNFCLNVWIPIYKFKNPLNPFKICNLHAAIVCNLRWN